MRELDAAEFKEIVGSKNVILSQHTLNHLSAAQRKVFKQDELIHLIKKGNPRKAYLQQNGNYAAYFRTSDGYRKVIIKIKNGEIAIITFMDVSEIPKIRLD